MCGSGAQFSSRWYLCARKSPYAQHPVSEVSPTLPLKQFQCPSVWSSLALSRKVVWRFLFPRLSPPGHRWCDVLGFVPAGSVSSFSTLQIFRKTSHLWGLLCPPVYLLGHLPSLRRNMWWICFTAARANFDSAAAETVVDRPQRLAVIDLKEDIIINRKVVVQVLLYVYRKRSLLGTGAQDGHLDFHTAPELWKP